MVGRAKKTKLIQATDTTSGRETTIKIKKVVYRGVDLSLPVEFVPEINIHQIEGTYETEEGFDKEGYKEGKGLVNFLSLDLLDARKLVNALVEEIQNSVGTANSGFNSKGELDE